ncbi:hypothetical protein GQ43DRAFT_18932 [Delitschia confertaspora ATCC 74209]|uniref:Uncharacterized protein n=1 Tax=Delitschia confertaspora ATCC 74209 TaxID=1513339 RepID=A0A9P4JMM8_9PLEO|nr:hypothetical protein GQ43DRAFT_18932 [Delitschia confertaspora ATCC 74209]
MALLQPGAPPTTQHYLPSCTTQHHPASPSITQQHPAPPSTTQHHPAAPSTSLPGRCVSVLRISRPITTAHSHLSLPYITLPTGRHIPNSLTKAASVPNTRRSIIREAKHVLFTCRWLIINIVWSPHQTPLPSPHYEPSITFQRR